MQIVAQAPAAAPITIASGASTVAFSVIAGEPGAGTQCNLNYLGSNRMNGVSSRLRAAGYMTCGAGTYTSAAVPIRFCLWGSNTASFAAASGNIQWTTTSLAIFTVTSTTAVAVPWEIEATIMGDNASGFLTGSAHSFTGTSVNSATPVVQTEAAIISPLTATNMNTEPPIQFTAGIITAASNLLNIGLSTVTLTEFVLEH